MRDEYPRGPPLPFPHECIHAVIAQSVMYQVMRDVSVHSGEGVVEKHEVSATVQGPSEGHTSLLTAREVDAWGGGVDEIWWWGDYVGEVNEWGWKVNE